MKFIHLLAVFQVSLGAICRGDEEKTAAKTEVDFFKVHADPEGRGYFPAGTPTNYYTSCLAAMKEPSLLPAPGAPAIISMRFLWYRSFHDPISVRIWRDNKGGHLRVTRLGIGKIRDSKRLPMEKTRDLSEQEWKELEATTPVDASWLPLNAEEQSVSEGLDGAQWIFERWNGSNYSMIDLWSPSRHGPDVYKKIGADISNIRDFKVFARLGLHLLKLANALPEESDVY